MKLVITAVATASSASFAFVADENVGVTVVVVVPILIVSDPAPVIAPILGFVLTKPLLDEVWPAAVCETVN